MYTDEHEEPNMRANRGDNGQSNLSVSMQKVPQEKTRLRKAWAARPFLWV